MGTRESAAPKPVIVRRFARVLRIAVRLLAVFVILIGLAALYQCVANARDARRFPPPGRLVSVAGQRLHLYCLGEGSPTVIFESGAGGTTLSWSLVQPQVAKITRACAYDRAGLGWSGPRFTRETAAQDAQELHALLATAGIAKPFILVGHSFGGFIVRVYAQQFPEEVAGMVLVDAAHPDQGLDSPEESEARLRAAVWRKRYMPIVARLGLIRPAYWLTISLLDRCQACRRGPAMLFYERFGSLPPDAKRALPFLYSQPKYMAAANDFIVSWYESAEQVRQTGRLGALPLAVLTREKGLSEFWKNLQSDLASLSTNSRHVMCAKSGHHVQVEEPQLVTDAIRWVIDAAHKADVPSGGVSAKAGLTKR